MKHALAVVASLWLAGCGGAGGGAAPAGARVRPAARAPGRLMCGSSLRAPPR